MSKNTKEFTKEQKRNLEIKQDKIENKKKVARIAVILILLILIIVTLLINFTDNSFNNSGNQLDSNAVAGQLEGKTPSEVQAELNRAISDTSFIISINARIEMDNGSAAAPVRIENVPNNHYNMKVTIKLKSDDTVVYESGIIEPNYHIAEATFNTVLKKGTYNAIAIFSAYNKKTDKFVGNQQAEIVIIVKK